MARLRRLYCGSSRVPKIGLNDFKAFIALGLGCVLSLDSLRADAFESFADDGQCAVSGFDARSRIYFVFRRLISFAVLGMLILAAF